MMYAATMACLMMLAQAAGAPVAQADADVTNRAAALAATVLPRDAIVAVRLPRFEADFAERLAADPRLVALERRHPGLGQALTKAAHDEAGKGYATVVGLLQQEVATLYRAAFTTAEIDQLIAFFRTPTGQAMIALSVAGSGDTASEFEANRRQQAMALLQNPDEQTKADLTALMQSGLLPKIRAINPQIAALSARRFGDVGAVVEAALPGRIEATIAGFIKKAPQ